MKEDSSVRAVRVALIGCGWAGRRHAQGYREAVAEVRWLIDTNPARAVAVQRELGAASAASRCGTDYYAALQDLGVEAVDICLPHSEHAAVAVAAAAAGKHILCEKPLATTLAEADRMIAAADAAGVVLLVAENVRFDPVLLQVRTLLHAGAIGTPALVQRTRECYLRASFLSERPWYLDARAAGGIMLAGGVHDFETLRMLLGEITSVYALRAPQRFLEMDGDDTSVALLRFDNGAVGTLVESFLMKSLATAAGAEVHTLRIDGDQGSLTVGTDRRIRVYSERPAYQPGGPPVAHELAIPDADTVARVIAHFLDVIRTGVAPLTSGRSQRIPLAGVLAAYRSMETGLPVAL